MTTATSSVQLDEAAWVDVELTARGKQQKSKTLRSLGLAESPESAHAFLLEQGRWSRARTPYADRMGVSTQPLDLPLPAWPEENRLDLTHLSAYAIDDDGNQDPDDALSIESRPEGGYRLWVHVSDVAALVSPNSELDRAARARGATLYLPDLISPMLPPELVAQSGLGMSEISPALSICLDLDTEGNAEEVDVHLTRVRVQRISYNKAQEMLEGGDATCQMLATVAEQSARIRAEEGAVEIDLPEITVKCEGETVDVRPMNRPKMRAVVQECMTLAGWATAIYAEDNEIAIPFAVQDSPSREVHGNSLAACWAKRKTLGRTRFQSQGGMHAGMGLDIYTQATSPMRRYLDLVVHQQLRAHLADAEPLSSRDVAQRIAEASVGSAGTRQAERSSRKHHVLRFIEQQPDRVWEAEVVERKGALAIFLVPELALDVGVSSPKRVGETATLRLSVASLPELKVRAQIV